jgi:hypothetical protein
VVGRYHAAGSTIYKPAKAESDPGEGTSAPFDQSSQCRTQCREQVRQTPLAIDLYAHGFQQALARDRGTGYMTATEIHR